MTPATLARGLQPDRINDMRTVHPHQTDTHTNR